MHRNRSGRMLVRPLHACHTAASSWRLHAIAAAFLAAVTAGALQQTRRPPPGEVDAPRIPGARGAAPARGLPQQAPRQRDLDLREATPRRWHELARRPHVRGVPALPAVRGLMTALVWGRRSQRAAAHLPGPGSRFRVDLAVHPDRVAHGRPACAGGGHPKQGPGSQAGLGSSRSGAQGHTPPTHQLARVRAAGAALGSTPSRTRRSVGDGRRLWRDGLPRVNGRAAVAAGRGGGRVRGAGNTTSPPVHNRVCEPPLLPGQPSYLCSCVAGRPLV